MMVTLREGDRGEDVRRLQHLLNTQLHPSPKLSEDGDFGARTERAVKRFQETRGLVADGVVGPKTWTALGQKVSSTPKPATPPAPTPPTTPGVKTPGSWMDVARAEEGVHENSLPGQHTTRIIEYHATTTLKATTDETPWCSSFVNWVMTQAGYAGTNNALAKSWLQWGSALSSPQEGAIVVIKKKNASSDQATGSSTGFHVAFYVSSTSSHIRLLGGNQGDQVKYSNFSLSAYEVKGYRWPG